MKYLSGAWSVFVQLGDGVGSLPSVVPSCQVSVTFYFFRRERREKKKKKKRVVTVGRFCCLHVNHISVRVPPDCSAKCTVCSFSLERFSLLNTRKPDCTSTLYMCL